MQSLNLSGKRVAGAMLKKSGRDWLAFEYASQVEKDTANYFLEAAKESLTSGPSPQKGGSQIAPQGSGNDDLFTYR